VVLPLNLPKEDKQAIEALLSNQAGHKVTFYVGIRDEKKRYLALANNNAEAALQAKQTHKKAVFTRVVALEEVLELEQPLQRMECFDISHTSGQQTVASCVAFNREGPLKSDYRRYNIEGITPGDDYAAMQQALTRRYGKVKQESSIPDIVFIDGGKGQLAQAEQVFENWSHHKVPLLIGVAKGTSRKPGLETLILAGNHAVLPMAADSPGLHLIQHIRDEAHRFAITGHRQRRQKAKTTSKLEQVPGIGSKRRQNLLKYLGGMQGVTHASREELAKVPGISTDLAQIIFTKLHC
jgi:excinuclease ABC subunit C